jgi:hypothetical protein
VTTDVEALYVAFRSGLRAALGKVPTRGLPRIGPLKDMSYGVRQFLLTDPGGNTVRVDLRRADEPAETPAESPKRRPRRDGLRPATLLAWHQDLQVGHRAMWYRRQGV